MKVEAPFIHLIKLHTKYYRIIKVVEGLPKLLRVFREGLA